MRDEEVRLGVERRGEEESIEDEEAEMYDTTPSSPTFSPADTAGRPLLGGARLPPRQQPAPRRRGEVERTGGEEVETPHAAPSSPTFSPAAMVGRPLLGGARLQPASSQSRTQHRAQLPTPISATSSRSQPRAMAQEPTPAASGSVIIFVDPWARDRQKLAEDARERASRAQWKRTVGGFEASTNANGDVEAGVDVDVEAGVDVDVEAGVDAQVEGRPRTRSRTPEWSASEPNNEGDHICAVCHQPLAPGTPPHIHLPPIRSQIGTWSAAALGDVPFTQPASPTDLPSIRSQPDAWSVAALDGAAFMQPDSPPASVFAPGPVGDHTQRMEPMRSLSPPRPSHHRPSYSDPFLAQVSETLHRAPQGYPSPPLSPTPSEWFRNRPVGALSRAPHFPQDADPFLAQVAETLHRDRRRSLDTYPSPLARNTPSERFGHHPSHPRASDPFLAQVTETLHHSRRRSPTIYPTPPLSPTPSEWLRNGPVSDRPRVPDPFLAQVPSTLHPNRQRSPPTHLELPPSEWFRNFEVAGLPEGGARPFTDSAHGVYVPAVYPPAVNPPAVYPSRHPEQEHLPQYEELYFEAAGEDEGYWPRRTDALRPQ